jgi:hypothetical protein
LEPERYGNEEDVQFAEFWIHKSELHESHGMMSNPKLGIVVPRRENAVLRFEKANTPED